MSGSSDRGQDGSFVLPGGEMRGIFLCGACGSRKLRIDVFGKEHLVRLSCLSCGNVRDARLGAPEEEGKDGGQGCV